MDVEKGDIYLPDTEVPENRSSYGALRKAFKLTLVLSSVWFLGKITSGFLFGPPHHRHGHWHHGYHLKSHHTKEPGAVKLHEVLPKIHGDAKTYEEYFLKVPDPESARNTSHILTSHVHPAGTEGDRVTALFTRDQFAEYLGIVPIAPVLESGSAESAKALTGHTLHRKPGPDPVDIDPTQARTWVDTYYSYLTYSLDRSVTLTPEGASKPSFKAKLKEDALEKDPTSPEGSVETPVFHGYGANGTASGPLIYAGFGFKSDFESLQAKGVNFTGSIVIVRYGGMFRGLKVKHAQEAGAVGILIYSDPAEDGEITEKNGYTAYPDGPARNPTSVQRGSSQFLSVYAGDPTTPFEPSYKDAHRVPIDGPDINIPRIPSLPLSYEDAVPLLKSLNGYGFQYKPGGLDYKGVEYFVGPGPDTVKLSNIVEQTVNPIWNTYAVIPGVTPDVVLIGNHRDAWVFGAVDPNSGSSTFAEIVKGYGALLAKGWKPFRTIILASWDAEEYGLIGSTEFGEDYAAWLKHRVVSYLNLDSSVSGNNLGIAASPSLADLYLGIVSDLEAAGYDVLGNQGDNGNHQASQGIENLKIPPLGSGSDFTVFLQHIGIASANLGYSRGKTDPVYHYHSIYDSAYWMDNFGDPSFKRHIDVSYILGLAGLRLADSLFVPLNISRYALELKSYTESVRSLAVEADFPIGWAGLRLPLLEIAVDHVVRAASLIDDEQAMLENKLRRLASSCNPDKHELRKVLFETRDLNFRRAHFESHLIAVDGHGLPSRPWYRNLVIAPALLLGYGEQTFPGVSEAITIEKSLHRANMEIDRLVTVLHIAAAHL